MFRCSQEQVMPAPRVRAAKGGAKQAGGGRQLRLETFPPARPKPWACDESGKQVRGWQKLTRESES